MKREVLKALALKAKNRMIHKADKEGFVGAEAVNVKVISSDDEGFYRRVRQLLEDDENIINPIKRLMDESLMTKLDPRAKEKYLLETIDKYHETRKRIQREDACKFGC